MIVAIRAEGVGKRYELRHRPESYLTMRDAIATGVRGVADRLLAGSGRRQTKEDFWALQDVSFDLEQGERFAVIGRNGAGKSTLLKILSRVTDPSSGRIRIHGRISSLLEVGTGFHPELSGRENIFLNGAILGMGRAAIKRKFEEIVAFAEVERFLDTPVKRFSSGMYVRLAFSVAAHLDTEILIVDEVLAVGDTAFQKKCMRKMDEITKADRTILFVSHNMAAVSALCTRGMVLDRGRVLFPAGDIQPAIARYLGSVADNAERDLATRSERTGEGRIIFTRFDVLDRTGKPRDVVMSAEDLLLRLTLRKKVPGSIADVSVAIAISRAAGPFLSLLSTDLVGRAFSLTREELQVCCRVPKLPLTGGAYTLNLMVRAKGIIEDWVREATMLQVEDGDFYGTGRVPERSHGGVMVEHEWYEWAESPISRDAPRALENK